MLTKQSVTVRQSQTALNFLATRTSNCEKKTHKTQKA